MNQHRKVLTNMGQLRIDPRQTEDWELNTFGKVMQQERLGEIIHRGPMNKSTTRDYNTGKETGNNSKFHKPQGNTN